MFTIKGTSHLHWLCPPDSDHHFIGVPDAVGLRNKLVRELSHQRGVLPDPLQHRNVGDSNAVELAQMVLDCVQGTAFEV